jgi:hypothetical protein
MILWWMKRAWILAIVVMSGVLLSAPSLVYASSISEAEFWQRLRRTETILSQQPPDVANQVIALWEGIDGVRLTDESDVLLPIDLTWLRDGASTPGLEAQTLRRVRALLAAHSAVRSQGGVDAQGALVALSRLSSRFQYPDATPTSPALDLPRISIPSFAGELATLLFALGGFIVVALLLLYFARGLGVQSARLPDPGADADDPTTPSAARGRASAAQDAGDLRAAVRYLYLEALLTLDENNLIRYDRALTNREHVVQIRDNPALAEKLRGVVQTFERAWYGFEPVSASEFGAYQAAIDDLRALTHRTTGQRP